MLTNGIVLLLSTPPTLYPRRGMSGRRNFKVITGQLTIEVSCIHVLCIANGSHLNPFQITFRIVVFYKLMLYPPHLLKTILKICYKVFLLTCWEWFGWPSLPDLTCPWTTSSVPLSIWSLRSSPNLVIGALV